jgi:integrase
MAREKLTDKRLATMKAPAAGRLEIFDVVKTGLCFRITSTGARSWSVMYRHDGHFRRETLGRYPKIGLAKARQMAGDVLETSGQGTDPRTAKAQGKVAAAARAADTVEAIIDQFVTKYAAQRRWPEYERILRRDIKPEWGERPMAEITRRDVIELLDMIAERAPVQANRTLVVLKVFFGWALDRDIITGDPTARVKKPTAETSRERVLSDAELRAFWVGCGKLGWPFGPIFRLLALTAARKSEIAEVLRPEIDASKKLIEIPGARYKTGKAHVIPLADVALAIIDGLPAVEPQKLEVGTTAPAYIFTTTGKTPVSGFSKAKTDLDDYMLEELRDGATDPTAITLAPWIIHDLRRTVRTRLSELGVSADIGERILGHVIGGVRGTYDRYGFLREKREALDRWAVHLDGVANPRPAKVVKMRRRTQPSL